MAHQSPFRPKLLIPTKLPSSPPPNRRLHRSRSLEESPLPDAFNDAESADFPNGMLSDADELRRDRFSSEGNEPAETSVDDEQIEYRELEKSDRWKYYKSKSKLNTIPPQAPGSRGTRPSVQVTTKPLLAAGNRTNNGEYARLPSIEELEVDDEVWLRRWPTWKEGMAEAKEQLGLGVPVAANYLLTSLMQFISVAFVGHLGTLPLAASAVAYSLAEITGFSLIEGLASAMETICGQAVGAEDFETVGLVTQRVHLLLTVMCVPVALLWLMAEPVLVAIGQDPLVASMAAQFLKWEIPGLFATAAFTPLCEFMEVHGVTIPLAVISALSLVFLVLSNYLCIYVLEMGFVGAAVSSSLTEIFTLFLALVYMIYHNRQSGLLTASWQGWTWGDAMEGWGMYLWDALPSACMICSEWWFFEILIIFSARLPDPQTDVSAMTIGLETITLCYMLPLAFSVSASVRVSLGLGADKPGAARKAMLVSLLLSALLSFLLIALLVTFRPFIVWVFAGSSAPEVTPVLLSIMPWLVLAVPGICIPTVLSGTLRGSGQQSVGSLINAFSYYAVALPLCYLLTFWPGTLRIHGLWVGMLVGDGIQAAIFAYLLATTDWKMQALLAEERVEAYAE